MNIIHILNGDATLHSFEQTGLEGETVVWREVLSEGPLEENISSGSFWTTRSEWICKTFNETTENYQQKMLDLLPALSEPFDEINLWFEFDLHCQANLLGLMSYMKQKTDLSAPAIFLICPAAYPGKENFMGLGELTGEELEYLYDNTRVQLSEIDFIIASEAWRVYVSHDAGKLKAWLNKTAFWGNLPLLKPALEAHLKRLEVNQNGLNYIEQKLLDIYNYGVKTKPEIYQRFWSTEKIYGLGDSQIDIYLNRLKEKGLITL
ncbi:MAG: DUF1835 domain-containing protein [Bacteroidota bacterium]|nr:DUF1835 domain-containing protein [Bacteroidota bacterium]